MIKKLLFLLLLTTLTFNHITFSIKIDLQSKIKLSEKVLLQLPISFCVTEDDLFMVVDFKSADVKIYNSNGILEKVLGRKGAGPNEFIQPLFCYYANRKFILPDVGQSKILFYDRVTKFIFKRTKEIHCTYSSEDLQLKGNNLYVSGNKISKNGRCYSFFAVNLEKNDSFIYILPAYMKFGLASDNEYKTELFKKPDITTIGVRGLFDIHGNFAYYIWEGDLKIFRINLKTKEISTFGKKMPHYIKPYTTKKLTNAFFSRQGNYVKKERNKMSYLKQIFTTENHVILIYTIPEKNKEENIYMVQLYKMDGNFVEELKLPGKASSTMWFDKKKNLMYAITFETNCELDEYHYILKYKINEN